MDLLLMYDFVMPCIFLFGKYLIYSESSFFTHLFTYALVLLFPLGQCLLFYCCLPYCLVEGLSTVDTHWMFVEHMKEQ